MKSKINLLGAVLLVLAGIGSSNAADNPCAAGLVQNVDTKKIDIKDRVHFVELINQDNFKEQKDNLGIIIKDISGNWNTAKKQIDNYKKSVEYKQNYNYSASVVSSYVSDAARKEFFSCVKALFAKKSGLDLAISDESSEHVKFTVTYNAAIDSTKPLPPATILQSFVYNGQVPSRSDQSLFDKNTKVNSGSSRDAIIVKNDRCKPVIAEITSKAFTASIATDPPKKEPKLVSVAEKGGEFQNVIVRQHEKYPMGTRSIQSDASKIRITLQNIVHTTYVREFKLSDDPIPSVNFRFGGATVNIYKGNSNQIDTFGNSTPIKVHIVEEFTPEMKKRMDVWGMPDPGGVTYFSSGVEVHGDKSPVQLPATQNKIVFSKPRNTVTVILDVLNAWGGNRLVYDIGDIVFDAQQVVCN